MFQTAVWQKAWDDCFWHYVCKTIYLWSRKVLAPTVFTEICSLSFFMEIKCYYNQRSSVETDRENTIPQNLCIILKLNEAWPLKGLNHCLTTLRVFNNEKGPHYFLRLLKFLILKKDIITVLKFLILKKDSITFLQLLKFLLLKKDYIASLRLLKVLLLKNGYITFLRLIKVFQSIYSVECWWRATSKDHL